jgi:dihydrodipicolinate synthase/N-acetylneuraminate lyase
MTRLAEGARGVFTTAATPFTETGELDLAGADRLVDFRSLSGHASGLWSGA